MDTKEVFQRNTMESDNWFKTKCEQYNTIGKYRSIIRIEQALVKGKWIDIAAKVWSELDNSPSIDMGLFTFLYADKFFSKDVADAIQASDFSTYHASMVAILKGEKPKEISLFKGSSLTATVKR